MEHAGVEETLVQAFEDPEQEFKCMRWFGSVGIGQARVCDIAGMRLAIRMKIDHEFQWPGSVDARDKNLEEIRNRWRKDRGLPLLSFHGPGIVLVGSARVVELVPELTGDKVDRRTSAIRRLSELGPGAWKALQAEIAAALEPGKTLLADAARTWANSLRSVVAESDGASGLIGGLQEGLHQSLDRGAIEKVLLKWFDDPTLSRLTVDLTRGGNGRGFTISVKATKFAKPGFMPQTVSVSCDGTMYFRRWNRKSIEEETQNWFEKLDEEMKNDLDVPFEVYLRLQRAGPEGAEPQSE
jgi:hypothetical protein